MTGSGWAEGVLKSSPGRCLKTATILGWLHTAHKYADSMSRFGERIRELRKARGFTLRELSPKVGVGFTYLSKIESGKLDFGDYPSTALN